MITAKIYWSEENDWGTVHSYEEIEEFRSYEDLQDAIDRWYKIGCTDIFYTILDENDYEMI